jgi:ABC-type Fe3+-hydroxamate transport system substrate-binding protein
LNLSASVSRGPSLFIHEKGRERYCLTALGQCLYDPRAMGRNNPPRIGGFRGVSSAMIAFFVIAIVGVMLLFIGRVARRGNPATHRAKEPRIVSLLPQATDIIVSIGCGDHLVAVSNYDIDPAVGSLPHVGDYQTTDWETIASLRPQWIITHYGPGHTPAGFIERADALHARRLNFQTETLDGPDKTLTVFYAIDELGKACNEPQKAADASAALRAHLSAIRARAAGMKPVPALIVIGAEGNMVAGKDTFLNELLELAGGSNVAGGFSVRYPQIDREQILLMKPQVILQLLPGASPQMVAQAQRFWESLPNVPAVKNGRVMQMRDWYMLLPGYHVGDIAEQFANALHPADGNDKTMR